VVMYANLYFLLVIYGSVHNIMVLLRSILWFRAVSANHYVKLNYVGFHFLFKNTLDTVFCDQEMFSVNMNFSEMHLMSVNFVLTDFKILNLTIGRYKQTCHNS
jgi:hypothetical protein